MKQLVFLVILAIGISSQGFAQLDNGTGGNKLKGKSIGTFEVPVKTVSKPESINFGSDSGFKNANNQLQKKRRKAQKEQDLSNKGILTPAMIRKLQAAKNNEKYSRSIPMVDMDLGTFTTTSKNLHVLSLDFGAVDGDKVTIFRNGIPIITGIMLERKAKTYTIPLEIGFNKIEILAINEGMLSPNTGGFKLSDDYGKVVISDFWNLAKGAKVIAMVIREEKSK